MNSQSDFISQLAKFLRLNGDRVMNGESKLSLITCALCILNNLFDTILFTADGLQSLTLQTTNSAEFFEDIKFLFDFIKKTPSLKVFHGGQTLRGGIDVSRFSNLKVLELHKVPMHLVIGLNSLCPQLTALFCHRSICSLKEIFGNVESETNLRGVWTHLKELNISHNYLEGFDQSLGMMPIVEYIDASHNNLKYVDEIQVLEKLTFLNLSYNLLENIPVLSGMSCHSIRVLFIRNNILENLEGLELLTCLEELDVSYNCISEHAALRSMKKLHTLKSLNLEGNPVFFHKRHRMLTARNLHSAVISRGILLNRKFMGPEEVLETMRSVRSTSFYAQSSSTHQTAINVLVDAIESRAELIAEPIDPVIKVPKFGFDETSIGSGADNISNSAMDTSDLDEPVYKARRKRKPKKQRTLVQESADNLTASNVGNGTASAIPSHIQTKQLFESRRKEYREGWLIPDRPFEMNAQRDTNMNVPPNTPAVNTVPDISLTEAVIEQSDDLVSSDATLQQAKLLEDTLEKLKAFGSQQVDEPKDIPNRFQPKNEVTSGYEFYEEDLNAMRALTSNHKFDRVKEQESLENSEESDDELEGCLFLVDLLKENDYFSICAVLKENSIKEIDSISGKVHDRLDLRSLVSVELNNNPLDKQFVSQLSLNFDTINTSRQKKIYFFDSHDSAMAMYSKLKPFADAKAMEDSIMGALQCLKCGSQFSKEVAAKRVIKSFSPFLGSDPSEDMSKEIPREASVCPNCGSSVVMEVDVMPVPSAQVPAAATIKPTASKPNTNADDILTLSSVLAAGIKSHAEYKMYYSPPSERRQHYSKAVASEQSGSIPLDGSSKVLSDISKTGDMSPIPRKNSDETINSNQSSSIIVISDTESNLDVAPEQITLYSPIPPSPDCLSDIMASSPIARLGRNDFETENIDKVPGSSSVTESLGHNKDLDLQNVFKCGHNVNLAVLFEGKEQFSCESFTSIDHRLKLHLEVGIFDNEENLMACLQASVVPASSGEEFDGLVVISSKKLYIMNFLKNNCDERFEKSIKQVYVCPLRQLRSVRSLLGSQGFIITSDKKTFLILVRDADLCNCFTSHLIDIVNDKLPEADRPVFSLETNEYISQINTEIFASLCSDTEEEDQEILLHLFGYFHSAEKTKKLSVCFIVTSSHIHVAELLFKKQTSKKDEKAFLYQYIPLERHKISDLIKVTIQEDLFEAKIWFQDEEKNVSSEWTVSTATKCSLFSFISAFKGPWDSIFGIELPLSLHKC